MNGCRTSSMPQKAWRHSANSANRLASPEPPPSSAAAAPFALLLLPPPLPAPPAAVVVVVAAAAAAAAAPPVNGGCVHPLPTRSTMSHVRSTALWCQESETQTSKEACSEQGLKTGAWGSVLPPAGLTYGVIALLQDGQRRPNPLNTHSRSEHREQRHRKRGRRVDRQPTNKSVHSPFLREKPHPLSASLHPPTHPPATPFVTACLPLSLVGRKQIQAIMQQLGHANKSPRQVRLAPAHPAARATSTTTVVAAAAAADTTAPRLCCSPFLLGRRWRRWRRRGGRTSGATGRSGVRQCPKKRREKVEARLHPPALVQRG